MRKTQLPSPDMLESSASHGCYYNVSNMPHGLRHCSSLLATLCRAVCSSKGTIGMASLQEHVPWLLDSYLLLSKAQNQAREASAEDTTITNLERVSELVQAHEKCKGMQSAVRYKAYNTLALFCSDITGQPERLLRTDEHGHALKKSLSVAFVQIAKGAMKYKSISRLVASQLLGPLDILTADNTFVGTGSDFWVRLLRQLDTRIMG